MAEKRIQSPEVAHVLNHSPLLGMVDSSQFWTVPQSRVSLGGSVPQGTGASDLVRELEETHLPHQAVGIERHHPGCG